MNDTPQGTTRADEYPDRPSNAGAKLATPMPPIERIIKRQSQVIDDLNKVAERLHSKLEVMMSPVEPSGEANKKGVPGQGRPFSPMADGLDSHNNSIVRVSKLLQRIIERIEI